MVSSQLLNFRNFAVFFFKLNKMCDIKPYLEKLHWLPISYLILFKCNVLIFKATNLSQPHYLSSLVKSNSLACGNRLSVSLVCPKKAIGRSGFTTGAPVGWNRLPFSVSSSFFKTISSFRSQPKNYLFRLAYPPP